MKLLGRLIDASNATFLAEDEHGRYVYKPVAGEAPLWDFPEGTLGLREVAAYKWSVASGFDVVPETTWVEGPLGPGSRQTWLEDGDHDLVRLVPPGEIPSGWFPIVRGLDANDAEVVLVHADDLRLRRLALFDVLLNNADRKGGHIIGSGTRVFGVDHGVCFHVEPKLRTIIWGWRGSALGEQELELVARAKETADDALSGLSPREIEAAKRRCDLVAFPEPGDAWPVIPWPPL